MYRKKKTAKLSRDDKSINDLTEFSLEQNTPNPFGAKTAIRFSIPRQCDVKLVVYDLREVLLCILYQGQLDRGCYQVAWEGRDAGGLRLSNGSYVYRLEADGFVASRRLKIGNR